jgi:hypothetical protein
MPVGFVTSRQRINYFVEVIAGVSQISPFFCMFSLYQTESFARKKRRSPAVRQLRTWGDTQRHQHKQGSVSRLEYSHFT